MEVKRYYVKDMQEAMIVIRKDLGPDAVILSQRSYRNKGLLGFFQRPLLEVMVAYEPHIPHIPSRNHAEPKSPQRQEQSVANPAFGDSPNTINDDDSRIQALDNRISSLTSMMTAFMDRFQYYKKEAAFDYDEEIEAVLMKLLANGVNEDLAHLLARETQEIVNSKGAPTSEVIRQLISEIVGEPAPIKVKKFQRTIVLFLGPTGVGKTTSLVKLAAHYAIKEKLKVGLINADIYRIAAQEQLCTYAEILQVPVHILYNISELPQILQELGDRDVIFIDTAGKSPKEPDYQESITSLAKQANADEVVLALAATMGNAYCREVIDHYSFIGEYKLLITKTDETEISGAILNACYYAKRPLAYLANGQTVPDDIAVQDPEQIISRLLN